MAIALKKDYITCLAYIVLADENKIYEKLLYLCRLSHGMGLSISSEEILRMGMEVDKTYLDKACSELKSWRYSFLTDTLIIANITEEASDSLFELIADMAKIMECEKQDLRAAAMVAKAVLIDNFDVLKQLPVPSKNRWMGQFQQHIPVSWIRSQRIKCGEICIEQYTPKLFWYQSFDNTNNYVYSRPCVVKKKNGCTHCCKSRRYIGCL
ncbi:MAG: hypothetical protein ACI4EY_02975 [Lachnospiraceae bacterium]